MPHPPLDPELALALASLRPQVPPTVAPDEVAAMRRRQADAAPGDALLARQGSVEVSERTVPGPDGDLRLVVLRPAAALAPAGPLPALLHCHGGGTFMGTARTGLPDLLEWVVDPGLVIVSVEYRLAPEHPHPAPLDDCWAALTWLAGHAGEVGADPARLLVGGASAGGGLAAGLALRARERGGPHLLGQLLLCAMLDDRLTTPSSHELHGEGVWDREAATTGWRALLGDAAGTDGVPAEAAPSRADDLAGLPPAYLDVGSVETFRDEDVDHAQRLWRAGVDAELHVWPGGFHNSSAYAPRAALSVRARAARTAWLRRVLAS